MEICLNENVTCGYTSQLQADKLISTQKTIKLIRTTWICNSVSAQLMSGSVSSSSGAGMSGSESVVRSNKPKLSTAKGPSRVRSWSTSSSIASIETLKRHGGEQRAGAGEEGDQRCATRGRVVVSPSTGVAATLSPLYLVQKLEGNTPMRNIDLPSPGRIIGFRGLNVVGEVIHNLLDDATDHEGNQDTDNDTQREHVGAAGFVWKLDDNCSDQSKRNSQTCKMRTVAIEAVGGVFANQTSGSRQHQATATFECRKL